MTDSSNTSVRPASRPPVTLDFPEETEHLHDWWRWAAKHGAIVPGTQWADEFRSFGQQSRIAFPAGAIDRPDRIEIGNNVRIEQFSTLSAMPYDRNSDDTIVRIHDNVLLGRMNQVLGSLFIEIGEDTATSAMVTFVDSAHRHDLANVPVAHQGVRQPKPISIGRGCLIQTGTIILGGVTLGDYVTVAANSLVAGRKEPFPSNCLLAGYPARVIRRND
jgi:acetyltransferase-like isoleucine patch superfamily enzyme